MPFESFLKIEGIEGDSMDKSHPGEIVISSFSWGVTQTGSPGGGGGGGGEGRAVAQDFEFTMPTSKASPKLMLACARGQHIRSSTLTCRKAGGDKVEFMKIKLTDVLVSSYQPEGATAEDSPMDQLSLKYVKIDFLYVAPDGETVEHWFDFADNVGQ